MPAAAAAIGGIAADVGSTLGATFAATAPEAAAAAAPAAAETAAITLPEVAVTAAAPTAAEAAGSGILGSIGAAAGSTLPALGGAAALTASDLAAPAAAGIGGALPGTSIPVGLGGAPAAAAPAAAPSTISPSSAAGGGAGAGLALGAPPQIAPVGPEGAVGPAGDAMPISGGANTSLDTTVKTASGEGGISAGDTAVQTDFGGGGDKSLLGKVGSYALNTVEKNPLLVPAAGLLGYQLLRGNPNLPAEGQLSSAAAANARSAQAMESYINTGKLPPGLQAVADQTLKANEAGVRSTFANLGLSGSTSEAQALAAARDHAQAQTASIAENLFKQGVDLSGMSEADLRALLQTQLAESQDFSKALSTFTAGLAGAKLAA